MEELNRALKKHGLSPRDINKHEDLHLMLVDKGHNKIEGHQAADSRTGETIAAYGVDDHEAFRKLDPLDLAQLFKAYLQRNQLKDAQFQVVRLNKKLQRVNAKQHAFFLLFHHRTRA